MVVEADSQNSGLIYSIYFIFSPLYHREAGILHRVSVIRSLVVPVTNSLQRLMVLSDRN